MPCNNKSLPCKASRTESEIGEQGASTPAPRVAARWLAVLGGGACTVDGAPTL